MSSTRSQWYGRGAGRGVRRTARGRCCWSGSVGRRSRRRRGPRGGRRGRFGRGLDEAFGIAPLFVTVSQRQRGLGLDARLGSLALSQQHARKAEAMTGVVRFDQNRAANESNRFAGAEERFRLAEPCVCGCVARVQLDSLGQCLLDFGEDLARGVGLPRQLREPVVRIRARRAELRGFLVPSLRFVDLVVLIGQQPLGNVAAGCLRVSLPCFRNGGARFDGPAHRRMEECPNRGGLGWRDAPDRETLALDADIEVDATEGENVALEVHAERTLERLDRARTTRRTPWRHRCRC